MKKQWVNLERRYTKKKESFGKKNVRKYINWVLYEWMEKEKVFKLNLLADV